jgi:hypothetical protein
MFFILDRTDGTAPLGIVERPVPQEPRQKTWPTQPFPVQGGWTEQRVVDQSLGTSVPGDPNRAVPNYVQGALYDPHWDVPILSIPGHGGGADWSHMSFSHRTGLVYTGFGYVASAHSLTESSNGLRPPGEYQTGGVVAVDVSTNRVRFKRRMPYSLAHGNGILTTASDLMFIGQPDGNLLAMDARTGRELWRFQTGAAISSSPIMYRVGRKEYLAVYAGGTSIPYGNSAPRGDFLWAFEIDGAVGPAPTPPPPVIRRPVSGGPVEGAAVADTVVIGRTYNPATGTIGATESFAVAGMAPTHLRVPAGTTVTFTNHPGNAGVRGVTQFFEGLFNVRLAPASRSPGPSPTGASTSSTNPAAPDPPERLRCTDRTVKSICPRSPASGRSPALPPARSEGDRRPCRMLTVVCRGAWVLDIGIAGPILSAAGAPGSLVGSE